MHRLVFKVTSRYSVDVSMLDREAKIDAFNLLVNDVRQVDFSEEFIDNSEALLIKRGEWVRVKANLVE